MIMYFLTLVFLTIAALDLDFPFPCSPYICESYQQADTLCDPLCMSPSCNFDSSNTESSSWYQRFTYSGCFSACLKLGCTSEKLQNTECDIECNHQECGFDLGLCGYCASGCTKDLLLNSIPDPICKTQACMFDNDAYGWCSEGCFQADLNSTTCNENCENASCKYQNLICNNTFCAPGCFPEMQNDTICHKECNNTLCNYNNWACACSINCPVSLQYNKTTCFLECDNISCNYQNYTCGFCASGCFKKMLGDGTCQDNCNLASCNYDWGDCSCAPGCKSKYDKNNEIWDMQDGCKYECLVEDCLYNYKVCDDEFLIRAAWLNQMLFGDTSIVLNLDLGNQNCTESDLRDIDSQNMNCSKACDIEKFMYCMGLGEESLSCSRSADDICLICKDTKQVYDYCFSGMDCPDGFAEVPELSSVFLYTSVCLKEPIKYSWQFPYELNISTDGINSQNTDVPLRTFHYALQKATRKFTTIWISPGVYDYTKETVFNPLVSDPYSPLEFSVSLKLEELNIIGDISNKPVIYIVDYLMQIYSQAKFTFIGNIIFSGFKALNSQCKGKLCAYCPYFYYMDNDYYDDRYNRIDDIKEYGLNCDDFSDSAFIITDSESELYIVNSDFQDFGQQLNAIIKSSGLVILYMVNFNNIITHYNGAVVNLDCKSSCSNIDFVYYIGSVTKLNNGYEYTTDKYQAGFIKITGYRDARIYIVTFDYNMVVTGIEGSNYNYLLYFKNLIGTVELYSCIFSNSFLNGIVYLDDSSLTYSSYSIEYGNVKQFSQPHFVFIYNEIRNVGTLVCAIKVSSNIPQNIYIIDTKIIESTANGEGFFVIENGSKFSSSATFGGKVSVKVDGVYTTAYELPRIVAIENMQIFSSYFGGKLISVTMNPNVYLRNIVVDSVSDVDYNVFNKLVIIKLIENQEVYLKQNLTDMKINDYSCSGLIGIFDVYYASVEYINIYQSLCTNGQNGLIASSINQIMMMDFVMSFSYEESSSSAILLTDIEIADISGFFLLSITKTKSSIFEALRIDYLNITSFTGRDLKSTYKSALYLDSSTTITISDFYCNNCFSDYGDGGALFIIPDTKSSTISIKNFNCNSCNAIFGTGGALNLDSYSGSLYHKVYISNYNITNSTASDGVALFISARFSFSESMFTNIRVSNCLSNEGGIITDFHKEGTVYISDYYSEDNEAYYVGVKGQYITSDFLLDMNYVYIIRSLSTQFAFYFDSIKDITKIRISHLGMIDSIKTSFIGTSNANIEIVDGYVNSGMGIYVFSSELNINGMVFETLNGYAITASSGSIVNCENCDFSSITDSSALIFDSGSYFTISNSRFLNINSKFSPTALSMSSCLTQSTFIDCDFFDSYSILESLITLQNSNLALINCNISNNTSQGMTPGISMLSSDIIIKNTQFSNQNGIFGGFLYLSTKSQATITDSFFTQGSASESGGAIYNVMSDVFIINCIFKENYINSNYGNGGALTGITSANFFIINSIFEYNKAPLKGLTIHFEGDTLEIYKSSFLSESSDKKSFMIYGQNMNNLTFYDSEIIGCMVSGIYTEYAGNVWISKSRFSNLVNAVWIVSTNETQNGLYKITNSGFYNNSAIEKGAGLYLNGASISISNTEFAHNSALYGGGLFFECPGKNCFFDIFSSNFLENQAFFEGGAIKWQDRKPIIEFTNFTNNFAPYGSNTASIPARLNFPKSRKLYEEVLSCIPGLKCQQKIIIELIDSEGNIMTLDKSSSAVLSISSNNNNSQKYSVSGVVKAVAIEGVFIFDDFIINGKPETQVNISISTTTIDPLLGKEVQDDVEYSDNIEFLMNLTECDIGQQIIETGCSYCLEGTYNIEPKTSCNSCPDGAKCIDGWKIYPKSGYWKSFGNSTDVYKCPLRVACLGSLADNDFVGTCAAGYEGKKCFSCIVGHTRSGSNKCAKCPSPTINAIILTFFLIFIIFVGIVLVRSTIKSAYSPKSIHSIYIKIFTNYIQLVFLTTQFELEWPWFVKELFNAQTAVATTSDKIFSLDCYFSNSDINFESAYYYKLITTAVTPIIIWFIGLLIWFFICLFSCKWKYMKQELITTEIVLFFLVYPSIVKFMFTTFSCTYIKDQGFYMRDNLIIKCWTGDHLKYSITIALPSIIIWAIGIPTLVLIIMTKRREYLKSNSNKVIFGFIFNGYKQTRFFWEFLIMYRKILIICVSVFMNQVAEAVQALTLIIILVATLYMQYEYKPYNKHQLNHMEMEAIFTATVTIYCGMFYLTQEIGEGFSIVLFLVILCGNLYFIVYWGYFMLQAVFDMLSGLVPVIRKMTGKNDPYPLIILDEKKIVQGVIKDEDEGVNRFTLIKKGEKEDLKVIKLEGIENMDDILSHVYNHYVNKLNLTRRNIEIAEKLDTEIIE